MQDKDLIAIRHEEPLDIRLEAVTFQYPGHQPILNNLSLVFPKGTLTIVRGESRSGKSTVLALLQRLYEPSDGAIMFGEFNAKYIRLANLRKHMVSAPQKIEVFSGSILYDIALADFPLDLGGVVMICRSLGILRFIESLPQEFQTMFTETGNIFPVSNANGLGSPGRFMCRRPTGLRRTNGVSG